jgi:hypothetical protein
MFSSSPLRGALVVLQLISSTFCSTFVPFSENHVHSKLQTQAATAGSITNISNVPTYVSQPQGNFDRTVAVLLLTGNYYWPKWFSCPTTSQTSLVCPRRIIWCVILPNARLIHPDMFQLLVRGKSRLSKPSHSFIRPTRLPKMALP